ncbi:hypothetical protein F5880DRAFT_379595 [Lentinula raphanica]|nr:hypothetical protein F5880DRAFT_379595 [Lentinula raphanica]
MRLTLAHLLPVLLAVAYARPFPPTDSKFGLRVDPVSHLDARSPGKQDKNPPPPPKKVHWDDRMTLHVCLTGEAASGLPEAEGGINIFVKPAPPIVVERFQAWVWQHFRKPADIVFEADESNKGDVYKLKDPTAECTFNYRLNDDPQVYRDTVLPELKLKSHSDHS